MFFSLRLVIRPLRRRCDNAPQAVAVAHLKIAYRFAVNKLTNQLNSERLLPYGPTLDS